MRVLLIEPLKSVAQEIERLLQLDKHECTWSISGQQGSRAWSNNSYDVLLMNFETDDWNATEVLANLLGDNRAPQLTIIYQDTFSTSMLEIAQELAPLMPMRQTILLSRKDKLFADKLLFSIMSVQMSIQQQEEVQNGTDFAGG